MRNCFQALLVKEATFLTMERFFSGLIEPHDGSLRRWLQKLVFIDKVSLICNQYSACIDSICIMET